MRRAGRVGTRLPHSPRAPRPPDSPAGIRRLHPACPGDHSCSLGERQSGPGPCGASTRLPTPLPCPRASPALRHPPTPRLTGAALGVAGTQPPEPGFTAIAARPLHMSPARARGLCLGEDETEGRNGSLPFYLKPLALEPRPCPISGMSLGCRPRTSQGNKRALRLPR